MPPPSTATTTTAAAGTVAAASEADGTANAAATAVDDGSRLTASSAATSMAGSVLATSESSEAFSDGDRGGDGGGGFWPLVVTSLYQSVSATAGGVVEFARSVAAELADLEQEGNTAGAGNAEDGGRDGARLRLPWEVEAGEEGSAAVPAAPNDGAGPVALVEDEELRAKILLASHETRNFLEPHEDAGDFVLDDRRILLIRELLEIDPVLARTHAKTSSRTSTTEALFWRNYFHHCRLIREDHLFSEWQEHRDASTILSGDDSSYVCVDAGSRPPSAPSSLNMLSRSANDLVILGSPDAFSSFPQTQGESPASPDKSQRHLY